VLDKDLSEVITLAEMRRRHGKDAVRAWMENPRRKFVHDPEGLLQIPRPWKFSTACEGLDLGGDNPCWVSPDEYFLERLNPRGCLLVAIPQEGGRIQGRLFRAGEQAERDKWIAERDGRQNIYFSPNPPKINAVLKKPKPAKRDMIGADWLWVDVDPRAGEDLTNEREFILHILSDFVPTPTIIIDSGNGFQALWRLRERIPFRSPQDVAEYERHNRRLAKVLGGDHCHNAERLLRLPGTTNLPNEAKRKRGRTPCRATVAKENWEAAYDLSDFDFLGELPPVKNVREHASGSVNWESVGSVDLDRLDSYWRYIVEHCEDPDPCAPPTKSRSEVVWRVACKLVAAGWTDTEIVSVLLDRHLAISAHIYDSHPDAPGSYAARQAANARAWYEGQKK